MLDIRFPAQPAESLSYSSVLLLQLRCHLPHTLFTAHPSFVSFLAAAQTHVLLCSVRSSESYLLRFGTDPSMRKRFSRDYPPPYYSVSREFARHRFHSLSTRRPSCSMSLSFKGHTIVVTGAGGGIGKAYVLYEHQRFSHSRYTNSLVASFLDILSCLLLAVLTSS